MKVDEHQHVQYNHRRNLERTWHLFATAPKPLHLIRLNPDQFNANGRRHNIYWARRVELQFEAFHTNVWGVTYLCYDGALKLTVPLVVILIAALAIRLTIAPHANCNEVVEVL